MLERIMIRFLLVLIIDASINQQMAHDYDLLRSLFQNGMITRKAQSDRNYESLFRSVLTQFRISKRRVFNVLPQISSEAKLSDFFCDCRAKNKLNTCYVNNKLPRCESWPLSISLTLFVLFLCRVHRRQKHCCGLYIADDVIIIVE